MLDDKHPDPVSGEECRSFSLFRVEVCSNPLYSRRGEKIESIHGKNLRSTRAERLSKITDQRALPPQRQLESVLPDVKNLHRQNFAPSGALSIRVADGESLC